MTSRRTVDQLGEFGLIDRLARMLPASADVVEGIGDDCAVLSVGGEKLLVSCDLCIEDVHFTRKTASAEDIGWKAAMAAFSDIAAMGGTPKFAVVSLACSVDTEAAFVESIYGGLAAATQQCGAVIVGGDTTRSTQGIVIDVTVMGVAGERYLTRSGARPGDALVVMLPLGHSAAGLHALQHGGVVSGGVDALVEAHVRPVALVEQGQWLAHRTEVHAMNEVTDGLVQDVGHICERSDCGADIDSEALGVGEELAAYCAGHGLSALDLALRGGEDYVLAMAVDASGAGELCRAFGATFGMPLTAVGSFTTSEQPTVLVDGQTAPSKGFDHFRL